MRRRSFFAVLAATLLLTGCYHQVVRTGATPGPVVVERPWTSTFFWGLVPASAINTATECPQGVAVVETQQSFVNGLVGALTLGIYTPQTVRITCAAGGVGFDGLRQIHLAADADFEARAEAMKDAIELAQTTGEPVLLVASR